MASSSRYRPHAHRSLSIQTWENGVLRMPLNGAASVPFTCKPALSHQRLRGERLRRLERGILKSA
eukprot:4299152-Prymnesium_polylepis.1